ncbi:MAG: phosphatase [Saprospirales bacterium]|nr:phosphatase [Saprospirales bacterium]MBK8489392.1 phosphatase [Saprospirales bacterium]
MGKYAVIDLGTNTFNLLMVEASSNGQWTELGRERRFIKLAEEGIGTIGKAAYARGIQAIVDYDAILKTHGVEKVRAFGTAALRTAGNGSDFIREIKARTGVEVQLIPGEEEARLIHLGVIQAIPAFSGRSLIMDIGGGSVEFILADDHEVYWAQSFPIGVAVLYKHFHESDPISAVEMELVREHLAEVLVPLREAMQQYPTALLIGASGSFDVLEGALAPEQTHPHHTRFPAADFYPFFRKLLPTTVAERLAMPEVPSERADMIIVALVLIEYVLNLAPFREILVSHFAMKEGMLVDLVRGD